MQNFRYYKGVLLQLVPHIPIDESKVKGLIRKYNAHLFRWTTNFDCSHETEFWHVICDKFTDLKDYNRNIRSQIKRGLKNCDVRIIDSQTLRKEGYEIYSKAFKRYITKEKMKSKTKFLKELDLFFRSYSYDIWGVFYKDELIGYSQNIIVDDYCDYNIIKIAPEFLNLYSSYALFYTMNKYYLNTKNFKYVNDGSRTLNHTTKIQEFLIKKFKFRKAYCNLEITYSNNIFLVISLLYPIRTLLLYLDFGIFKDINIILRQESIRRSFEKRK